MKKRLFSLLFLFVLALTVVLVMPTRADAGTVDYLTYEIDNGEVTITDCKNPEFGNIVIPNTIKGYPVTKIGNEAFYNCDSLTSIIIPNSVTSIGDYAFSFCDSLTSVTIPDSVTSTGNYAFYYCTALTSVTIPDGVISIDDGTFGYCTSLTSVTIPDGVISIDDGAFSYCTSLTSLTIPESVTSIGDVVNGCDNLVYNISGTGKYLGSAGNPYFALMDTTSEDVTNFAVPNKTKILAGGAFEDCSSLTSVTIPDSVTSIGSRTFRSCYSLTSVTIPDGVTSIGNYAFYYCTGLTSVTIPDGVISIDDGTFGYCTSLTSVTIGDSVTNIGDEAFEHCESLTSLKIPHSVDSIGDWAFCGCKSLTSFAIPDSVTSIGDYAFNGCYSLTLVTIGDGVSSIGSCPFVGCDSLTGIWVSENNENYSSDTVGVLYNKNKTELMRTPAKLSGYYEIPDSVTSIGDSAFSGCSSLTSVTIGDSVTSIGGSAFSNCTGLTSVIIPDSVTQIYSEAFVGCSGLTSLTVSNSVTVINFCTFAGCSSLTSVIIPDSVDAIGEDAFAGCSSLTSLTISDGVTFIGNYAFSGCSSLRYIYYTGTQSQWQNILIAYGNEDLTDAEIYYEAVLTPGVELKIRGASLALQSDLSVGFTVNPAMFADGAYTDLRMEFRLGDENAEPVVVTDYILLSNGNRVYMFNGIAPRMLNETVYAKLYGTYMGTEYSVETSTSIYTYCNWALSGSDAKLKRLVVDLMNYASAHQIYANYKTDALANRNLTPEQQALGNQTDPARTNITNASQAVIANPTARFTGAALYLQNKVEIRFTFSVPELTENTRLVVEVDGQKVIYGADKFVANGSKYYVDVDALAAKQMRSAVDATLYEGDTAISNTLRYSIESFVAWAYGREGFSSDALDAMMITMLKYGDSAYAFFN